MRLLTILEKEGRILLRDHMEVKGNGNGFFLEIGNDVKQNIPVGKNANIMKNSLKYGYFKKEKDGSIRISPSSPEKSSGIMLLVKNMRRLKFSKKFYKFHSHERDYIIHIKKTEGIKIEITFQGDISCLLTKEDIENALG